MDRTRQARLERKDAAVAAAGPLLEEPQGIVQAIVSVTGVVDGDGDIIEPGAYTKTLAHRTPKVVWHHDWKTPVGRVLEIEELMPGDPRLPKTTRDGKPWPAEAGALVVTKQYNLRSKQGREAFEAVRFYSESGEAEYSIGYVVPDGKARRGKDGIRRIKELELFEISPVLFGANSLSGTLSVKSADPGTDAPAAAVADDPWGEDVPDDPWSDGNLPATYATGGTVPGVQAKSGAPGVADTPQDLRNVERLRRWYTHGEGAKLIGWNTPGDFARCQAIARRHMPERMVDGWCAKAHHEATGQWPGRGAHGDRDGGRGVKCFDGEGGSRSIHPSGSWEERRDLLLDAVRDFLLDGEPEEDQAAGQDPVAQAVYPPDDTLAAPTPRWVTVDINGTWEDRVIVTRYGIDPAGAAPLVESYEIPYAIDDDGVVELGEPAPVKLTITPIPTDLPDDGDGEGDGEEVSPLPGMVEEAAAAAKALYALSPDADAGVETKAGRVLSGMNARRLRAAVQQLLAVLAAAGVNITSPVEPRDDEPDDDGDDEPAAEVALAISDQQDSTAPAARPASRKSLDVDPLAYAAQLRAFAASASPTAD